jgi:hypothetical protein
MDEKAQEITTVKKNGSRISLGSMEILSSAENGFQIKLKSSRNFKFLRDSGNDKTFKLGGVDCYLPRGGNGYELPGVPGQFRTEKDMFHINGYLNLSLLLARDLKDGVVFNFGTFPVSDDKIEELAMNFKNQIKIIWATYMRDISIAMEFSATIVENEEV